MYLLGYFVLNPQDNLGGGFGIFKMNLISFFDQEYQQWDKNIYGLIFYQI